MSRALDAFGPRSWARPEVISTGRLRTHADVWRPETLVLDGDWHFSLRDRPEAVTQDDVGGAAADEWPTVEVPGCWTMQGYDRPQYTNVAMPFPGPPPRIPDENPTGVYRRRVEVPAGWAGKRIVLLVGGAESVLYVHVDGQPVGMGKDSRLPQEFDLTGVLTPGEPAELCLTVVKWSDATYLEDQDHWYHAGLHRSVVLYATPPVHIADVYAVADYDPDSGVASVDVRVELGSSPPDSTPVGAWTVRAAVAGSEGESPAFFEHPTNAIVNMAVFQGRGGRVRFPVEGVEPWSAETPRCYDLEVSCRDGSGAVVDVVRIAVGFRRVEVRGCELLVNGRPVLIKGVNRHDHDPVRGKAVTRESIERDIVMMKQHNLNAVRTSHYPADGYLYEVCDRLGMYVVDEANVETHAYLRSLTRDPSYALPILDRVIRMCLRDRNHPSVIAWSLGNESGVAPVHLAAAEWLRAADPTRPIHYESGISEDDIGAQVAGTPVPLADVLARPRRESDLIAPMYPPVESLVEWATRHDPDRPLVMCEYCHAMGNSCGGLAAYWDAIRTHRGLQGGFIWDWVDQALVQRLPDGTERLAYGGDFGDEPNDGAFCMNGVVAADRTPHPSLFELAAVSAPVRMTDVDAARGLVGVVNEHDFVDLSHLDASFEVSVEGVQVAAGTLDVARVPPGGGTVVECPLPPLTHLGDRERADLTVTFTLAAEQPWAPQGHVVARAQFPVVRNRLPSRAPFAVPSRASTGKGEGRRDDKGFDALEPRLQLWRAPIDNETFGSRHAARWERLGLPAMAADVPFETMLEDADDAAVSVTHIATVPPELTDIGRVGVRLRLSPGIDRVEWLGVGPHECYEDRRASGIAGRYVTAVDDWPVPYVHPQASGNRVGVRWLGFFEEGAADPLIVIDELDDLQVTVARHTDEELDSVSHLGELAPSGECYVWIDAAHRGVGSGACGPDTTAPYRVQPGTYRWSYRLLR